MLGVVYRTVQRAGMDYVSYAIAVEELSRRRSVGVIVSAHNSLCLSPIYYFGTEDQKKKYSQAHTGEWMGCFGITSPAPDRTPRAPRRGRVQDGKWVLTAPRIHHQRRCRRRGRRDRRHREGDRPQGPHMFIVEKGRRILVGKVEDKLGICASSTTELVFDTAPYRGEHAGKEGRGLHHRHAHLDGDAWA